MRKIVFFILATLSLVSCLGITKQQEIFNEPLKTAQFESGDKTSGLINMSIIFDARNQRVPIDETSTLQNINLICQNWGYSHGVLNRGTVTAICVSFNMQTGKCQNYKFPITAICKK